MLSKLVKKKKLAFSCGERYFNLLKNEYFEYVSNKATGELSDRFIGVNVFDVTKYIYNNKNFDEYMKYSFLAKKYEKKIISIEWLIILFFVIIGFILYLLLGMGTLFIISVIVLFIVLFLIFIFVLKTGESYSSYYNRTMLNFLLNIYTNLSFTINTGSIIADEQIKNIIDRSYDKKNISNVISFNGKKCSGNIFEMDLIKIRERKNKDGTTVQYNDGIFDGLCLKLDTNNNFNMFRGNVVKIRCDENIFSSLTEDTVKGIYESNFELSFNSEEMNKSFDGRISGYNGFNDLDEMMIQVQKVITPSFEQHLLYLRERYNSFNMNISDNGLAFAVNMGRSVFQKAKHNELLDFKKTYREANEEFRMVKADVHGIEDFAYYNIFPFLERLYLINYLTYLYLSYMDFDNYYSVNSGDINNFEESMKEIYTMDNKEFRELYTDKIKEIKNNLKEYERKILEEEK